MYRTLQRTGDLTGERDDAEQPRVPGHGAAAMPADADHRFANLGCHRLHCLDSVARSDNQFLRCRRPLSGRNPDPDRRSAPRCRALPDGRGASGGTRRDSRTGTEARRRGLTRAAIAHHEKGRSPTDQPFFVPGPFPKPFPGAFPKLRAGPFPELFPDFLGLTACPLSVPDLLRSANPLRPDACRPKK